MKESLQKRISEIARKRADEKFEKLYEVFSNVTHFGIRLADTFDVGKIELRNKTYDKILESQEKLVTEEFMSKFEEVHKIVYGESFLESPETQRELPF